MDEAFERNVRSLSDDLSQEFDLRSQCVSVIIIKWQAEIDPSLLV